MLSHSDVAPTDFDFIIGSWTVAHRRLNSRLAGCTDWTEFAGTSTTRKILRGFGNVEDNVLHFPAGSSPRSCGEIVRPEVKDLGHLVAGGRRPHHLDVPVVGRFAEGVGSFYANDVLDGRPIRVRFFWHPNPGSQPRWEQAFSVDGGSTWEVNWVMPFQRVAA